MDYINYVIFAGAILFLIWRMMPTKGVKQISTTELKVYLTKPGLQFIDVRTSGEFKANHIRQFKNIPLHQLGQKTGELPQDKGIVVICQSGMRSNKASKILKKNGFKNIMNVKGGMSAWN
jgi:rhodanese-related sulfurtransferase